MAGLSLLAGCGPSGTDPAVLACIEKGIAYFKEIESYPRLSTGQPADEAASERCHRTDHAFDY